MSVPANQQVQVSNSAATGHFRPDIEGLRALAILAVVLYHAEVPGFTGGFVGVDIFFVISGFLITGLLLREASRSGRIRLGEFYARRVRRLLPAALLVLATVTVASWALLPPLDYGRTGTDIAAAAVYLVNLRFAGEATEYLNADLTPSPVLHFWSLAVEEQFYLVWPMLIVAVLTVGAQRRPGVAGGATVRARALTGLGLVLAGVGLASLLVGVWLTWSAPSWAFFAPWSRAWQFAAGGLLALLLSRRSLSRVGGAARAAAGFVGLALILTAVVGFGAATAYPGWAALVPTTGTVLLLWAGAVGGPIWSVTGILSTGPATSIGRISYSWYLWHWPVLVLAVAALGDLPWPMLGVLVLLSAGPAFLSFRFLERPLRRPAGPLRGRRRPLWLATGGAAGIVLFATVVLVVPHHNPPVLQAGAPEPTPTTGPDSGPRGGPSSNPQRSSTRPTPTPRAARGTDVRPPLDKVRADLPLSYRDGCHAQPGQTSALNCWYGTPRQRADRTWVLFGDSHAAQWLPALASVSRGDGAALAYHTMSGCPATPVPIRNPIDNRPYDSCAAWNEDVRRQLIADPPDLAFLAEYRRTYQVTGEQDWDSAMVELITSLQAVGSVVVVLSDTPARADDPAACLSKHPDRPEACAVPRSQAVVADELDRVVAATGASTIDLTDGICTADSCPAVRAGMIVHRDEHHLTATYAAALGPAIRDQVRYALQVADPRSSSD